MGIHQSNFVVLIRLHKVVLRSHPHHFMTETIWKRRRRMGARKNGSREERKDKKEVGGGVR